MRCQLAGRALARVVGEFPDISIDRIEFLTNRKVAREAGVRGVPALIYGDKKLSGILLTKAKIRTFLEDLGD